MMIDWDTTPAAIWRKRLNLETAVGRPVWPMAFIPSNHIERVFLYCGCLPAQIRR